MSPDLYLRLAIEPALSMLPAQFDSPAAKAFLLSVALQESGLKHRRQIGGSARSMFQFEQIGIEGVLRGPQAGTAVAVMISLAYPHDYGASEILVAIEHNDILATVFARLLLWSVPEALPGRDDATEAFRQYVSSWKPGKPHPDPWPAHWSQAWEVVG